MSNLNLNRRERLLIVDDEPASRELCHLTLQPLGYELVLCSDAQKALDEIARTPFDLVLTDMVMPGLSGIELLERLKAERSDIPVLLMSGKGSISLAVQAMRLGAEDFIEKPLSDPEVLALAVKRALKARRLEEENRSLRQEINKLRAQPILIGGAAISAALRTVERIAPMDLTVLITGETGTGKEVFARRIHALSPRANKPFIAINCGGIPHGLLESLLFGHEKGAFTGAVRRSLGYFEKAHRGTILLDEVGDMPVSLQVKLLRVLQEKSIQRVGGEGNLEVDCQFREDLYYRLNVLQLPIPPLRERLEDLPALALHFLKNMAARMGKPVRAISPEALACLRAHRWPGNIRELENALERSIALTNSEQIEVGDLPEEIIPLVNAPLSLIEIPPYLEAREEFEQKYLTSLLDSCEGNVTQAAKLSGIPRQNLYLKLNKYGIKPAQLRGKIVEEMV